MKKRIIFDLDNTLIIWKDEYVLKLKEVVDRYKLDVDYKVIDNIIEGFESKYGKLSREQLACDINEACNINIDQKFIQDVFDAQKCLSEVDLKLIDLLDYLSSKYELVVLSNYYTEVQIGRLENAKILKYFKEVIGGDMLKAVKPDPNAFFKAMGPYNVSECIMIGDSYRCDIEGALNVGMDVIFIDARLKKPDYKGIKINEIYELKEML